MNNPISILILLSIYFLIGCSNQVTKTESLKDIPNISIPPSLIIPKREINTRNPLLISHDLGETWVNASQDLSPDIQVSFLEKKGHEIVMATDNKGLFISSKNQTKWRQIGLDLPNKKINALHISGKTIYVGVYRAGIFKSTDSGTSWESLNFDLSNLNVQTIWKLADDLFVGTDVGISKYIASEKSWKPLAINAQVLSIYAFEDKLVAGTSQGTIISVDKGENWNWIRKNGAVHYTHNIGKRIVELGLNGDLNFSDDWGNNWITATYESRYWSYIYELVNIKNQYVMSNNYGIHRSSNQGKNWELVYATESMAFFDLLVIDNKIYGGTRAWDEFRKRKH